MKTIDMTQLDRVTGGVVDSGDGLGCTRTGGCTPMPFPLPGPPPGLPGNENGDVWPTIPGSPIKPR